MGLPPFLILRGLLGTALGIAFGIGLFFERDRVHGLPLRELFGAMVGLFLRADFHQCSIQGQ